MFLENRYSQYDYLAATYHDGVEKNKVVTPILEKLLLQYLPEKAHILDLGCGIGSLVQYLLKKGYQASGIDGSEAMLNRARENTHSGGSYILDDARFFKLPPSFHAVVSISALVHIMSLEELTKVFQNTYTSLLENGWFLFNLCQEELYQLTWNHLEVDLTDDYAVITRASYEQKEKIGQSQYTMFQLIKGEWQRSDTTTLVKPYSPTEVQSALEKVGFINVSVYDAKYDLGIDKVPGRMIYVCRKLPII